MIGEPCYEGYRYVLLYEGNEDLAFTNTLPKDKPKKEDTSYEFGTVLITPDDTEVVYLYEFLNGNLDGYPICCKVADRHGKSFVIEKNKMRKK